MLLVSTAEIFRIGGIGSTAAYLKGLGLCLALVEANRSLLIQVSDEELLDSPLVRILDLHVKQQKKTRKLPMKGVEKK